MRLRILNDVHIGTERSAGTTVDSRWKLRQTVIAQFKLLLPEAQDLMILGDLFNDAEAPQIDLFMVYSILDSWLTYSGHHLYVVAGNHDLSKTSNVFSSFDLLCQLLRTASSRVTIIKEPTMTPYGYVIPHLANQDLFNKALKTVPASKFLFLHVNYDNFFAAQSDQSLNISKEQVDSLPVETVIIGHEHNFKQEGKVLLPGSQTCTSVSDWIGAKGKFLVEVEDNGSWEVKQVQERDVAFIEQDWKSLEPTEHTFVRVVGHATAEQAAQVASTIAKFRAISEAFVVSNAVQIEQNEGLGDFSGNLESVQAFDVWKALVSVLDPAEVTKIEELT